MMAQVSPANPFREGFVVAEVRDQSSRPVLMAPRPQPHTNLAVTPPAVFPAFQDPATMADAMSMAQTPPETAAMGRRPGSRSRPKNLSINALPAFEFGAGSSSADARGPSPSPTRSPHRRNPTALHSSGHRRGGSEFVGGDVNHVITAGISPDKSEEFSQLAMKSSGPPAGRRGHAHKRSGALSQHDLSMILKPGSEGRGGSAPTTPSDQFTEFPLHSSPLAGDRSLSQPASTVFSLDRTSSPSRATDSTPRARVTFNSDPEFIPRPLSTISSETSSSMSTIRANHSTNDSVSSILSGNASSPAPSRSARSGSLTLENAADQTKTRSVGTTSQQPHSRARSSSPSLELRPCPTSAPMQKFQASQRHDNDATSDPDLDSLREGSTFQASESSENLPPFYPSSSRTSPNKFDSRPQRIGPDSLVARPRTSPEPKQGKKQKKVKSWAGSILSRRSKSQSSSPMAGELHDVPAVPADHALQISNASDFSLDNITFDEDTTCIIERPQTPTTSTTTSPIEYPTVDQHNIADSTDYEYPVLDMDAALASLERSDPHAGSKAALAGGKRRMHSSGETGGFSGPGMHYHRRTESAPELDFFDYGRLGFVHRGSNPAMAEAIKEEEEEDDREGAKDGIVQGKRLSAMQNYSLEQEDGLGVNIVDSDALHAEPVRRRTKRLEDRRNESISPKSHAPQPQHVWGGVEIVGADEEPRSSVITKSSDESTITPTLSPEPQPQTPTPLDMATQPDILTDAIETTSSMSSPDFDKTSFDHPDPPRIHTATSSITDRTTLSSTRAGEFGHGSIDDVPSLTSSASTMISGLPIRVSSSANTTASSAERSSSLSAAVPARTSVRPGSSKRSSLASLSRLVGGSYNRSKLNIAELASPPDSPDKTEKKKNKRRSRLMFWKSREKLVP